MKQVKLYPEEIRMSFFFFAIEPIPEDDLLSYLQEKGFEEVKEIPRIIGTERLGFVRANIARKGSCEVLYDPKSPLLGVVGKNRIEVLDRFEEIEKIIEKVVTQIKYYDLFSIYKVFTKSKNKPLNYISEFLEHEKFSKFKEIFNTEVAPFSIRFYPKSKMNIVEDIRNISNWFDVQIYPYISNPQYYGIQLVFRDTEISNVKKFIETMEDKIQDIIKLIEDGKNEKG